jgi:hypothetical protein
MGTRKGGVSPPPILPHFEKSVKSGGYPRSEDPGAEVHGVRSGPLTFPLLRQTSPPGPWRGQPLPSPEVCWFAGLLVCYEPTSQRANEPTSAEPTNQRANEPTSPLTASSSRRTGPTRPSPGLMPFIVPHKSGFGNPTEKGFQKLAANEKGNCSGGPMWVVWCLGVLVSW